MTAASAQANTISDFFPKSANPYWRGMRTHPLIGVMAEGLSNETFQKEIKITRCSEQRMNGGLKTNITWAHPGTGLEAELEYAVFPDTGVLEFGGRLVNRGRNTIRALKGPFSLFLQTAFQGIGLPKVTTVYGGASTEGGFPPPSYRVVDTDLPGAGGINILCGREGGRSTETWIPMAIVTDSVSGQGFFLHYEWPCRSIIQMGVGALTGAGRHFSMWAHPGWTMFDFEAGASVTIPRIVLGFFRGDSIAGSNALRRHIVRHVRRPVEGASALPPVFYNHYYGFDNEWTVRELKREADAYADLGIEYFVVDAGWFTGGFRDGIGNWDRVDPKHFPEGMEEFAHYVESRGMKFGSWLEIEFAMKNSDWVRRHPDWYRDAGNLQCAGYYGSRHTDRLLRLEDKSVRSKVAEWMEAWVKRYRIQWLRWDFNDAPLPFWMTHESEKQMGRLHIGYGEGLLALLDDFMTRCPQVHIEACAGGGHRIDLGTFRRAHSCWMNDNSSTYDAIRRFQAGLNRVYPGNYGNSCFLWITHPRQRLQTLASFRKTGYAPCIIRSRMGGTLGFAEQSVFWNRRDKAYLKAEVERYKAVRRFIMEDYYPLFAPKSLQEYDGWQFHDPETQEGFAMVFRCEAKKAGTEILLQGAPAGLTLELTDMDSGRRQTVKSGKTLPVAVPGTRGTRWFSYRPQ